MIDTGRVLRECRRFRSLTQQQLGQISGISRVTISRLENNSSCNTHTLEKCLNAMGFRISIEVLEEQK